MDAVIKVFCSHMQPDFSLPWQRSAEMESSSSVRRTAHATCSWQSAGAACSQRACVLQAFVIEDLEGTKYLLTNAHSVEYHAQVRRRPRTGATCRLSSS